MNSVIFRRARGLLLIACLFCSQASAENWPRLSELIEQPIARGTFTQQKQILGLPVPLHSQGEFAVIDTQLVWRTKTPFISELRIAPKEVSQWEDGKQVWRASADTQPLVATLAAVMLSLVSGDADALANVFSLVAFNEQAEGCWELELRPRDSLLASQISQVVARGCAYIAHLSFTEAEGDQTHITMSPAP